MSGTFQHANWILTSGFWTLEDSLDSVVLETFQGVDQGCEPADIFAFWILHSGVYRMHNPEKRCLHSLFCILYSMQMSETDFALPAWGRSLDSGFGFCDLQDDGRPSRTNPWAPTLPMLHRAVDLPGSGL